MAKSASLRQEAMNFSEALTSYETWQQTPTLPERIELRFVMPGRPNVEYVSVLSRRPCTSCTPPLSPSFHVHVGEALLPSRCPCTSYISRTHDGVILPQRDPARAARVASAPERKQRHRPEGRALDSAGGPRRTGCVSVTCHVRAYAWLTTKWQGANCMRS